MPSYVHCIISKDRYKVAVPTDWMHHWWDGHESPVCITLDNTHLYYSYDQSSSTVAVGFPAISRLLVIIIIMSISFLI
jgi:hypothetical protein